MSDELLKLTFGEEEEEDPLKLFGMEEEEEKEDKPLEELEEVKLTKKERKERKRKKSKEKKVKRSKGKGIFLFGEVDEFFSDGMVRLMIDICSVFEVPITFFMTFLDEDKWEYRVNFIRKRYDKAEIGIHGISHTNYSELEPETVRRHIATQARYCSIHMAPGHSISDQEETLLARLDFKIDCSKIEKEAKIEKKKTGLVTISQTEISVDHNTLESILKEMVKHIMNDPLVVLNFPVNRIGCMVLYELLNILKLNNMIDKILPLNIVLGK